MVAWTAVLETSRLAGSEPVKTPAPLCKTAEQWASISGSHRGMKSKPHFGASIALDKRLQQPQSSWQDHQSFKPTEDLRSNLSKYRRCTKPTG